VELTGEDAPKPEEVVESTVETSNKPFFVLIADAGGNEESDKIDSVILKDERIALGARAFRAVRMTPEDASNDPLLAKHGKESPRFVFVSADFKNAVALEKSRVSISAVWDQMKTQATKFYGKNLDATVKEMRGILLDYDKIDGERTILKAKEEKLKEKKGAEADLKEVEAKLADLEERQKKMEEKEQALWDLRPKSA
jgi:hypothetical protein